MTLEDLTHYALSGGEVFIYKTPADATYTIGIIGSRFPEEKSVDTDYFNISPELYWGLIWRALSLIAEINADTPQADRYNIKAELAKVQARKVAARKNKKVNKRCFKNQTNEQACL